MDSGYSSQPVASTDVTKAGRASAAVAVRQVTHSYRGQPTLSDLTFDLSGGAIGIVGPNGAGKTTLLKMLATVLDPQEGSLEILGLSPRSRTGLRMVRRRIGYLPQNFGYYSNFTTSEFVQYAAWLREVPRREIPDRVQSALESVGLSDRAQARMGSLSGGMLRRAGIAQALVNTPELLVLDEPASGLDPRQRAELRVLVRRLATQATIVLSTHLIEDVESLCSEVLVVCSGCLIFKDRPERLADLGERKTADLGDTPIERGYNAVVGAYERRFRRQSMHSTRTIGQ